MSNRKHPLGELGSVPTKRARLTPMTLLEELNDIIQRPAGSFILTEEHPHVIQHSQPVTGPSNWYSTINRIHAPRPRYAARPDINWQLTSTAIDESFALRAETEHSTQGRNQIKIISIGSESVFGTGRITSSHDDGVESQRDTTSAPIGAVMRECYGNIIGMPLANDSQGFQPMHDPWKEVLANTDANRTAHQAAADIRAWPREAREESSSQAINSIVRPAKQAADIVTYDDPHPQKPQPTLQGEPQWDETPGGAWLVPGYDSWTTEVSALLKRIVVDTNPTEFTDIINLLSNEIPEFREHLDGQGWMLQALCF